MSAVCGSDFDEHDLVHGIVLPELADVIVCAQERKREFSIDQARQLDFTSLPVRMNHNDDLGNVGTTVAYRVIEASGDHRASANAPARRARAETLHKLNREADHPDNSHAANMAVLQRNLLMMGDHRGLSLAHKYEQEWLADCGKYVASASGRAGRIIFKTPYEISTCSRGKRPGSEILEYLPCKRSLRLSSADAVRAFARQYKYTEPARELSKSHATWPAYLDSLWSEVRERRHAIMSEDGYAASLRQRGIVAASAANQAALESAGAQHVPWRTKAPDRSSFTAQTMSESQTQREQTGASSTDKNASTMSESASTGEAQAASASAMATDESGKTSQRTTDVVPNDSPSGGGGGGGGGGASKPLDEREVQDQTFAAFMKEKQLREATEKRLKEYEERDKERREAEEKARQQKSQEEERLRQEAMEAKRKREQVAIASAFETLERNTQGAIDASELRDEKQKLLDLTKKANNQAELDLVGNMLGLAVRASESAAKQSRDIRQRELQQYLAAVNGTLSAPPPSSIATSAGETMNRRAGAKRERTYDDGIESGIERASFNIFAPPSDAGAAAPQQDSKRVVTDVVPDQRNEETGGRTKLVDMSAENWGEQACDDFIEQFGQMPSRRAMLQGGVRREVRVVASANGPQKQEQLVPRLSMPLPEREFSAKTYAPDLFKKMLADVNKCVSNNGKRPDVSVLQQMAEQGRLDKNDRPVHMTRFTGPLPSDNFQTLNHSMGVY